MSKSVFHIFLTTRLQLISGSLLLVGFIPMARSQTYFQQKVAYQIDVTLHDTLHTLSAFEKIEYTNNSPDTLQFLYFHLWPNAYSNNKTPLAKQIFQQKGRQKLFNNPELRGSIDSLNFKVDDLSVEWSYLPDRIDVCKIILANPLFPGGKILISTPFYVKIPKGVTSRLGHIDQSYQISQWYPKPAVYDKNGWHPISYLDQGEFYSEFGTFEVNITLPDNYIVGASGVLQNKEELEKLDSLAKDTLWKGSQQLGKSTHHRSVTKLKTLRYVADNMHDFAWFADKEFNLMQGSVVLPESGRVVTTWVLCTQRQSKLWLKSLEYCNQALLQFSKWIGDYPYSTFTVVQSALSSGLGMEYPGITVIGTTKNAYTLDEVITHEIGHSWFYAALGSNERRYPFMDESITNEYEKRYLALKYPTKKQWDILLSKEKQAKFLHADKVQDKQLQELSWLIPARNNIEQAVNLGATDYSSMNYSEMIYNKGSMDFRYLRSYLGDSLYDASMNDYYSKWKFKHPQPEELRKVFKLHTDKELSWFFDDLLGSSKRLDYKIVRRENQRLLVKNNGELLSPLVIGGLIGDSLCYEKWSDGFSGERWIDFPEGNYTELKIDPNHVTPELYRMNNNIRMKSFFPRADPIVPQFLFGIENPEKHSLMYIPAVNWNYENGFMAGIALYNGLLIPKPIEWIVIPFYSYKNATLAGFGKISFNITPYNNLIQLAKLSIEGNRFGAPGNHSFQKLAIGGDLNFRPDNRMNPIRKSMYGRLFLASDLTQIENALPAKMNPYLQLGYKYDNTILVNPYKAMLRFESGVSFQKVALEFNYTWSYVGKNNGLDFHFFSGTMLNSNALEPYYLLAPSGRSGREQYLYEGVYPDRFGVFPTTFLSRQMNRNEGGLISPINEVLGYSKWLFSLSLSSDLPGKLTYFGTKPFVNLLVNNHGLNTNEPSLFFAEAGIKIGVGDFFEIDLPFLVTPNIQQITGSIQHRIRFVMNLDLSSKGGKYGL
jgi:hypothetical protein